MCEIFGASFGASLRKFAGVAHVYKTALKNFWVSQTTNFPYSYFSNDQMHLVQEDQNEAPN